jgi:CelD/BcsL family acetyltransferase involved in cellulose biosynthesis
MNPRLPHTFESFRPAGWDAAAGARRTPMQQHIWASAYAETLARGPVDVYALGGTEAPLALAPFARSATGTGRWTLLGAEDIWESVEVSAPSQTASEALADLIVQSGRPFRFGHYPSGTAFAAALQARAKGRGLIVQKPFPGRAAPRLTLDASWADPASKLSARRRSDLKRMARIAGEFGETAFEIACPGPETVDGLVDEAFQVEARNWKGRAGTAMTSVGPIADFYRAYARRAAAAGILRLCFLRIDGAAVAMQIAVECDSAFWLLKIGYVEDFRRCSPGNLLMRHSIEHAARRGLGAYEFLGKESEWTRLWTEVARPVASLRFYPLSAPGAVTLSGDAAEQVRRHLQRRDAPARRLNAAPAG